MTDFRFLILDFRFGPLANVCAGSRGDGAGRLRSPNQKSQVKNLKSIPGVRL